MASCRPRLLRLPDQTRESAQACGRSSGAVAKQPQDILHADLCFAGFAEIPLRKDFWAEFFDYHKPPLYKPPVEGRLNHIRALGLGPKSNRARADHGYPKPWPRATCWNQTGSMCRFANPQCPTPEVEGKSEGPLGLGRMVHPRTARMNSPALGPSPRHNLLKSEALEASATRAAGKLHDLKHEGLVKRIPDGLDLRRLRKFSGGPSKLIEK